MKAVEAILKTIYDESNLPRAYERRKILIEKMHDLESSQIHCFNCPGTCCTSQANSMMTTPIEALEIIASLNLTSMDEASLSTLKNELTDTVRSYRLDVEVYTGKKMVTGLRKTYTCPFFKREAKGCALSRSAKPYGCLGFNPAKNNDNGQTCNSDINLLTTREDSFSPSETTANEKIKHVLKLDWDKKNMPQALLEIIAILEKN